MANDLAVQLDSSIRDPDEPGPGFRVVPTPGSLTIHGQLSVGSRGWRLRAAATRRRSVVTLHVTAVEVAPERWPDLEHHRYTATVQLARAGRYSVRVAHSFLLRDLGGLAMPRPVFEDCAVVPAESAEPVTEG